MLSKLEIYTFGCAANHFNNPHRHAFSQRLMRENPSVAAHTLVSEKTTSATTPGSSCSSPADVRNSLTIKIPPPPPPSLPHEASSSSISSTRTSSAAQDRAIGHIEHYAHSTDFVAIWGVLHFATNRTGSPQIPRFLGRLFVRSTGGGGHQLNQHYLDGMFPLLRDLVTGELVGADEEGNEFMREVVKLGVEGDAMENIREAFDLTYAGDEGFGSGDISTPVEVHGVSGAAGADRKMAARIKARKQVRMKDLCRLWGYRNGKSPPETPPLLLTEGGVVRNATM